MAFLNSVKLRKDLSSIADPNPERRYQKIIAWATYATERQNYIESIKGAHNYSELMVKYDAAQPRKLWNVTN